MSFRHWQNPELIVFWILCPELWQFHTTEDQTAALRRAYLDIEKRTTKWYHYIALLMIFAIISLMGFLEVSFEWVALPFLLIVVGTCVFVAHRLEPIRKSFRRQLMQRGVSICFHCGCNLTGNTSGVCPECGGGLKLEI